MVIRLSDYDMFDLRTNGVNGLNVGDVYAVAEEDNVMTGEKRYIFKSADSGFAGNMGGSIKRYHGWRGTTNNWSIEALGVFEVLNIERQKNGKLKVTLSKDLHTDWE